MPFQIQTAGNNESINSFIKYHIFLNPGGEGIVNVPRYLPLSFDLLRSHARSGAKRHQDAEDGSERDSHAVSNKHRELFASVLDEVLGSETSGVLRGVGQPGNHATNAASDDSGNHS